MAIAPIPRRRVSWGAIWAGMFVTLLMQIMFTLLGVACGIATLNPLHNMAAAPGGLSYGAAIWLMVSWLVSVWIGSCVAGWMSAGPRRSDGTVHGLVVWSFSSAIILLLTTGVVGTMLGSTGSAVGYPNVRGLAALQQQQTTQPNNALSPTGRTDTQQPAQNSENSNSNQGGAVSGANLTGQALWGFIALILGLAVAAWGGSTGVASSERSLVITSV
ncbi:MAG TPA: hypothetical protein VHI52_06930 [Verrucomicrobiae bacterium]|nr:hypothetical protein [Verrucomicrobiae bacterium]